MISLSNPTLTRAVVEAKRIRRDLLRRRGEWSLQGDCGLASLMLASALGSPRSLRLGWMDKWRCEGHVWNMIGGVVVDITASQFTEKRGVYVGPPLPFHKDPTLTGLEVFQEILDWGYSKADHPKWPELAKRWPAKLEENVQ